MLLFMKPKTDVVHSSIVPRYLLSFHKNFFHSYYVNFGYTAGFSLDLLDIGGGRLMREDIDLMGG